MTVDQLEADAIRVAAAVQPVEIRDPLAQQAQPRKSAAAVPGVVREERNVLAAICSFALASLGNEELAVRRYARMVVQAVDEPGRAAPRCGEDDERCGSRHALETLSRPHRFPTASCQECRGPEEHECGIYG